jgi:hypothetical protein
MEKRLNGKNDNMVLLEVFIRISTNGCFFPQWIIHVYTRPWCTLTCSDELHPHLHSLPLDSFVYFTETVKTYLCLTALLIVQHVLKLRSLIKHLYITNEKYQYFYRKEDADFLHLVMFSDSGSMLRNDDRDIDQNDSHAMRRFYLQ